MNCLLGKLAKRALKWHSNMAAMVALGLESVQARVLVMHLLILCPTTPHTGHRWGLVGINRDLHVNFDPRGGAFDLSPAMR